MLNWDLRDKFVIFMNSISFNSFKMEQNANPNYLSMAKKSGLVGLQVVHHTTKKTTKKTSYCLHTLLEESMLYG